MGLFGNKEEQLEVKRMRVENFLQELQALIVDENLSQYVTSLKDLENNIKATDDKELITKLADFGAYFEKYNYLKKEFLMQNEDAISFVCNLLREYTSNSQYLDAYHVQALTLLYVKSRRLEAETRLKCAYSDFDKEYIKIEIEKLDKSLKTEFDASLAVKLRSLNTQIIENMGISAEIASDYMTAYKNDEKSISKRSEEISKIVRGGDEQPNGDLEPEIPEEIKTKMDENDLVVLRDALKEVVAMRSDIIDLKETSNKTANLVSEIKETTDKNTVILTEIRASLLKKISEIRNDSALTEEEKDEAVEEAIKEQPEGSIDFSSAMGIYNSFVNKGEMGIVTILSLLRFIIHAYIKYEKRVNFEDKSLVVNLPNGRTLTQNSAIFYNVYGEKHYQKMNEIYAFTNPLMHGGNVDVDLEKLKHYCTYIDNNNLGITQETIKLNKEANAKMNEIIPFLHTLNNDISKAPIFKCVKTKDQQIENTKTNTTDFMTFCMIYTEDDIPLFQGKIYPNNTYIEGEFKARVVKFERKGKIVYQVYPL